MPVWSLIKASELSLPSRWDAEYYTPHNLRLAKLLSRHQPLPISSFADVTDGIHASPEWVLEGGTPYLSAKCVRAHAIDVHAAGQISKAQDSANPRTKARVGDVIITSVGTIGNAAVVEEWMLPANMDRHLGIVRIRDKSQVDPYYLAAFLNSSFGRFQSVRESTGNVQLNLFIDKIRGIRVPVSDRFQSVSPAIRAACEKQRLANDLYPEAESELLGSLGWDDLKSREVERHYTVALSHISRHRRSDAEFFHPQYVRLRKRLARSGSDFGSLVERFDKGMQPDEYCGEGSVAVVKSKQVTGRGLNLGHCERTSLDAWSDESSRLSPGDLVLNSTGRGTLGRAGVVPDHNDKVVAAVDLVIARLRTDMILPEYAALFLNSPAGLAQSEQFQTGSSGQLHLYPQHFAKFIIYVPKAKSGSPDINWQRRLVAKIKEADTLRLAANRMFELATHEIEKIIQGKD